MKDFSVSLDETGEIGSVVEVNSSIFKINGLPGARLREKVISENGVLGQVFSLREDYIEALALSPGGVRVGEKFARMGEELGVEVGDGMLGSVVDGLGRVVEGKWDGKGSEVRRVDVEAAGLVDREMVREFLETGVGIVDLVLPIGKGQRELVVGDRKTGRTSFALRILASRARAGDVCVYCLVGKRQIDTERAMIFLKKEKIADNVVLVSSGSSSNAGEISLTPYTAMTIAEYFRDEGKDVFIVLDDLTTHAKFYREISLLSGRFPGRDSYPGDVFYAHSRLLERAGNFKRGSITCLPLAESVVGDLSGYIQTNLMAMTDGHIFFDISLFNKGLRPAIDPFLSVTRVGRQTQGPVEKEFGRMITIFLMSLKNLRSFMHFGAELTEQVKQKLVLGEKIEEFFYRHHGEEMPLDLRVFILAAIWGGWRREWDLQKTNGAIFNMVRQYRRDEVMRKKVGSMLAQAKDFKSYLAVVRANLKLLEGEKIK